MRKFRRVETEARGSTVALGPRRERVQILLMLTTLVLGVLLPEAAPAGQADAGRNLPSGTPAATTPATRDDTPVDTKKADNPVFPPLPDGTAGSQVLEPGKSPVEPDRGPLPTEMSDVPLAPTGPAPPSSTQPSERHTGKTGGGASRVDSIR